MNILSTTGASTIALSIALKMDGTQLGAKINMDSLGRQKALACQALAELQELWKERQRDKNKIRSLQKKIEQQQEDIDKLAAKKEKQNTSIKQIRLQLLAQNNEKASKATKEKDLSQKIHQEKVENMAESKKSEDSSVGGHQNTLGQLQHLIIKTQKVILEAKQAKEQMKKTMVNIKHEIQENKKYVTQQKSLSEHIKFKIIENVNSMKKRCTEIPQQQPVFPELQSKDGKKGKSSFSSLKRKLQKLLEETNKLSLVQEQQEIVKRDRNELKIQTMQMQKQEAETNLPFVQPENNEMKRAKDQMQREKEDILRDRQVAAAEMEAVRCEKENIKRERTQLADQFEKTKRNIREMEVLGIEIDGKKRELTRMIRMSRIRKCEVCETDNGKQEMEVRLTSEGQQSPRKSVERKIEERSFDGPQTSGQPETQVHQVNMETNTSSRDMSGMQRVALEVEEHRKKLTWVRENTERGKTSQVNSTTKSELTKQDGSRKQEKPTEEEEALESESTNMQQQERMVEENVQQTAQAIQQMSEIKTYIQKAAAEINNTKEEMIRAQRMMKEEKVMVKQHMVGEMFFYIIINITSSYRVLAELLSVCLHH